MIPAPSGDCCPACGAGSPPSSTDRTAYTERPISGFLSLSALVAGCCECILGRRLPNFANIIPTAIGFLPRRVRQPPRGTVSPRSITRPRELCVGRECRWGWSGAGCRVCCALFGRLLADRGYQVFGLDFSPEAGRSRPGVKIAFRSSSEYFPIAPFPERFFATITMFHVLEHLHDPASVH